MVKRLIALLGMAVVMMAIASAMLAGAAIAAAETGADSGAGDTKTSESTQHSDPKSDPDPKTDPVDKTTTGGTTTQKPEAESDVDEKKPAEHTDPKPAQGDSSEAAEATKPVTDPVKHGKDSSDEVPGPAASKTNKPHADEQKVSQPVRDTPTTTATESPATSEPDPTPAAKPTTSVDDTVVQSRPTADTTTTSSTSTTTMSARTTAAITQEATPAHTPTLVDVVGSIVLNLVMGLIHVFDGPPVLPPGSTVTVRTSTLTIGNQTVEADWYFPADADPTRLIYLQHGLLASGPMYSYTAATLAEQTHSIVVAPSLTSNWFAPDGMWLGGTPMQQAVADLFAGDRAALTESASAAAGYDVTLPDRFVLAGHSLGGSLVMGAAGDMVDNGAIDDLAGVLLLDSVDVGNTVPTALQKLTGVNDRPVYNISSERYVWNMDGVVDDELEAARPGRFNGVMLVGGRHIDALQGGNPLIQFSEYLVAGFSQPQNIEAVKILAVGWVNDMFAGTHNGIYGTPQQAIEIPTTAGTATAVALPPTPAEPIQGTPFDWLFRLVLPLIGGDSLAAEPVTV
ncbi:alpha/beta hydrolase [Mycobacterium sp. MMS18-G62]